MRKLITIVMLVVSLQIVAQTIPYYSPYGRNYWSLHQGLNLQLDFGVGVGFGKNNPMRNGMFYTNASAIFLKDLTPRLSVAGGATLSHIRYGGNSHYMASIEGIASYQLTERLTAMAFASYTAPLSGEDRHAMCFNPYYNPYYPAALGMPGVVVGGGVDYKVTENFHVGVSASWHVPVSQPRFEYKPQSPYHDKINPAAP